MRHSVLEFREMDPINLVDTINLVEKSKETNSEVHSSSEGT